MFTNSHNKETDGRQKLHRYLDTISVETLETVRQYYLWLQRVDLYLYIYIKNIKIYGRLNNNWLLKGLKIGKNLNMTAKEAIFIKEVLQRYLHVS